MIDNEKIHCFWHDTDDFTITSQGIIWAYPGKLIDQKTVCVLPPKNYYTLEQLNSCYAICTNNIYEPLESICKK